MSGPVPLLPLHVFMVWTRTTCYLYDSHIHEYVRRFLSFHFVFRLDIRMHFIILFVTYSSHLIYDSLALIIQGVSFFSLS
jgi:hypothetical protein